MALPNYAGLFFALGNLVAQLEQSCINSGGLPLSDVVLAAVFKIYSTRVPAPMLHPATARRKVLKKFRISTGSLNHQKFYVLYPILLGFIEPAGSLPFWSVDYQFAFYFTGFSVLQVGWPVGHRV